MKKLIIVAIILVYSLGTYGWEIREAKEKLYDAFISGNQSEWIEIMDKLEYSYHKTGNIFTLFELVRSQYGYMGYLIDIKEFEKVKNIIEDTEENIDVLLEYNPDWVDVYGLKAGVYGFKIILFPNQVILNGMKGKNSLKKASSFKEITPALLVEMANYKYHTPELLGGNIDEAITYYQYAIKLFELTKQKENNWQYISTMVWLAISYDRKGETSKAKNALKKVLQEEPEFTWVKNELYPKILRNESISKTYISMTE